MANRKPATLDQDETYAPRVEAPEGSAERVREILVDGAQELADHAAADYALGGAP